MRFINLEDRYTCSLFDKLNRLLKNLRAQLLQKKNHEAIRQAAFDFFGFVDFLRNIFNRAKTEGAVQTIIVQSHM